MDDFNMDDFIKPDDNGDENCGFSESKKPSPRGAAYRRLMARKKKKKRMKIIGYYSNSYNPIVGFVAERNSKKKPDSKYVQYPNDSHRQKFWKRYTSRVARSKELPPKGNGYRKQVDYQWELD